MCSALPAQREPVDGLIGTPQRASAEHMVYNTEPIQKTQPMSTINKFEEYQLFIGDTAHFTDRRQNVTNVYIVIVLYLVFAVGLALGLVTGAL